MCYRWARFLCMNTLAFPVTLGTFLFGFGCLAEFRSSLFARLIHKKSYPIDFKTIKVPYSG